ncbi:hypothetical protein [Sphingomonas solaris]|uniref:hypothetical protein n=1 Tax=Alterirhizorhabdus solaris TaxID=2529389 RepID=UPI001EEFDBD6|nr:hypothetical protein [Sphingomonas solaris]
MVADRGGERMQRVRIGLTGLACVFLLVLLAAAFFGLTNDERRNGPLVVTPASAPAENSLAAVESPREPLAELGVAPGYAGDAGANTIDPNTATPPPALPLRAGTTPPSPPAPR